MSEELANLGGHRDVDRAVSGAALQDGTADREVEAVADLANCGFGVGDEGDLGQT